jgi:hypothetical protein
LDDASDTEAGLFTRISRLAEGRRVGKRAQEVGDLAFDAAIDDEVADRFIFEDERWTAIASVRDAMLAAIEAIHHASFPRIIEAENVVYEVGQSRGMHHTTSRLSGGIVPAWVLATEAAERARQAAKDAGGSEGGKSERAWQRERLAQALRGA